MERDVNGDLRVFSGSTHQTFARTICDLLQIPLATSELVRFANGNLMPQIGESVRDCDVFVIQTQSANANLVSDALMELFLFVDALKRASAKRITAVMPYFSYSRSDKKDRPRIPIGGKLIAQLLKASGVDRLLVMDLHSDQVQGFFDFPVDQLEASPIIVSALKKRDLDNHVLVAADAGHAKRMKRYRSLKLPVAIIEKDRIGDTDTVEAATLIGDVRGKNCILMDDEIATAGTVGTDALFLYENGALSVRVAATHAVFCGKVMEHLAHSSISGVMVTDTIPVDEKIAIGSLQSKIEVLSVTPLFAEAIRRIHDGRSVSELFHSK